MTNKELIVRDAVSRLENLKIGEGASTLTDWGKGYNQGIEAASEIIKYAVSLSLLRA